LRREPVRSFECCSRILGEQARSFLHRVFESGRRPCCVVLN
jgi:hypothetical protein